MDLGAANITDLPSIQGNTVNDAIIETYRNADGGTIELLGGIVIQWDAVVFSMQADMQREDFRIPYASVSSYIILATPQYANSFVGAAFSTSRQSASRAYIYIRNVDGGIISGGGGVNWLAIGIKA